MQIKLQSNAYSVYRKPRAPYRNLPESGFSAHTDMLVSPQNKWSIIFGVVVEFTSPISEIVAFDLDTKRSTKND